MPVTQSSPPVAPAYDEKNARPDVSTRTALIRVLTDLFAVRAHHTDEEIRHYQEIVLRMLPDADSAILLDISRKLAAHPKSPLPVLQALMERDQDCAAVILAKSAVLTEDMLTAAAQFGASDLAAAVARRPDVDSRLVEILVTRHEDDVWRALAFNDSASLDVRSLREMARRGREDPVMARAICTRTDNPGVLLPLFLHASKTQRATVILEAERDEIAAGGRRTIDPAQPDVCEQLEKAALAHNDQEFRAILAVAIKCDAALASQIVSDEEGEPLAISLSALGMSPEAIMRVFLTGDATIAQSCDKIETLYRLVSQISLGASQRICRAMLGAPVAAPAVSRAHRPQMDQTAAPTASRPATQTIAPAAAPARKLPLFLFKRRLR